MGQAAKAEKFLHGVLESEIKEAAVDAALEALDIRPAEGMKLAGRVELIVEHSKGLDVTDLADCARCKGTSPAALPACAFCGDEGLVEPGDEGPSTTEGPVDAPDPDDGGEGGGEDAGSGDDPGAAEDAGIALDPNNLPETKAEAPRPQVKLTKAEKNAAKAAAKQAAKEAKEAKAAKKANPLPAQSAVGASVTAIVPHVTASPVIAEGVAQLDQDVAEIQKLDRGAGAAAWQLARKITEIAESQRWKLRLDEKGKVKYRTFEDFAKAELSMSREYALIMQKMYLRNTKEDFEQIGPSKLRALLQAPPDQQAEVLEKLKTGELGTRKAVQEDVKNRRTKAGLKTSQGKPSKGPKKERAVGSITVASIIGKGQRQLFKKPLTKDEDPVAAKSFDGAYAHFDLGNDTRCWIYLQKKEDGKLLLKYDIRRIED